MRGAEPRVGAVPPRSANFPTDKTQPVDVIAECVTRSELVAVGFSDRNVIPSVTRGSAVAVIADCTPIVPHAAAAVRSAKKPITA